ncbi:MAG: hypothetical protein VYE04_14585 [Pseudomonadota bacterium]|nr:hypothetical protein [Pseudomonadota bacterium]
MFDLGDVLLPGNTLQHHPYRRLWSKGVGGAMGCMGQQALIAALGARTN